MKNFSLKELYRIYQKKILENSSDSELDSIINLIEEKESKLNENTSATGGPSGAAGSSSIGVGSSGVALSNATTAGMGGVVSPQPSAFPGALNGTDWINGGGKSGSGDVSVPYNPSGKNRVFQKVPMGKAHGSRTGKKSRVKGIDLKNLSNILKNKNKSTDMKPREKKVLNFDDFQKDKFSQVTKVKEGKAYKSSKPDKKIGKEGIKLTDKKENFRTEVKNLVKSHDDFSLKQVGNDLSIHKDGDHILQVMFRDDYVGVQKVGNKFPKEFEYNELGKIKKEIGDILKKEKE
jgi:hypothetical protein